MESQAAFRTLLAAMADPMTIHEMTFSGPPLAPFDSATLASCLTLLDLETPVWIQPGSTADAPLREFLRFHCGCPLVSDPPGARFALIHSPLLMPSLSTFHPGSGEFPDRSATLIIRCTDFVAGEGYTFDGPGFQKARRLRIDGLPDGFWQQRTEANRQFPMGIDCLFTSGRRICAAPRTTIGEY